MYRVVITDDEPFISKGLAEKIDWFSLGCEVCGIATNGYEGKKLIDELNPDIVVTDIVMPGHTGLELADYVHQNKKEMIVILLSGYDEFTYAKEALKYGVFEYLLKPTVKEEVVNVIQKAVKTIEKNREKDKKYEFLQSTLHESIPLLEQSLLHDIVVNGLVGNQSVGQKIQITVGKGAVITIDFLTYTEINQTHHELKLTVEELFESEQIKVRIVSHGTQLLLLPTFSEFATNGEITSKLKDISNKLMIYCQSVYKMAIGIGGIYPSIHYLHASYLQSTKALSMAYFFGVGKVYIFDDINSGKVKKESLVKVDAFIGMFEEWKEEEMLSFFERTFKGLKYTFDKQLVINYCLELLIKLGFVVAKWDKQFSVTIGYEQLEQCKTFDVLQDLMKKTCLSIKNDLYQLMNKNNVVDTAKVIVAKEFDNPDLSAQFIADHLNVSLSHLSRSFKKETGENLSNYVTEKRMQIAQKLLETTDLKTNEIAKKVGFLDARYFGQVFKKVMSTTPSAYKKNN